MFEINLIPDIKGEMVKAQKVRNIVLFVCIVISIASAGIILLLFSIKGGQDVIMTSQDSRMKQMSEKLSDYDNLDEFLTIQSQLGGLSNISDNRVAASRVFDILSASLPTDGDVVTLSQVTVDLESSTITLEGQADAKNEPLIDYRVLESMEKSVGLLKYDYGEYVDKNGATIPNTCISETDESGSRLVDDSGYYANWNKSSDGCNPSNEEINSNEPVKIYRTPYYDTKLNELNKSGYLSDDGVIDGIAHFQSSCMTYTKEDSGWSSTNSCTLASDGMTVTSSSNGKDTNNELVLRFTANIVVDSDVFLAKNKNMAVLSAAKEQNVTDSYLQVEGMFAKRASDCKKDDTSCQDTKNSTGN